MPKRSAEEKINSLRRKLLKLEKKQTESLRALETPARDTNTENEVPNHNEDENEPSDNEVEHTGDSDGGHSPTQNEQGSNTGPANESTEPQPDQDDQELDPDLLSALGEAVNDDPKWGPNIHQSLTDRWTPLLRKGLPKDVKDKLFKDYAIPENCRLLQAPKLNAEISAATTDLIRNRDKKMENSQQQLGLGLTALNQGLTTLLTGGDKISAIQHLSNSCRILGDLHYLETQVRTKIISSGLAKSFLTVIQESQRDDTLFGENLSDKIKASKAIEKQGLQIKKPAVKATAPAQPRPSNQQGNWQSPARFPSNRGGRGGRGRGSAPSRRNTSQSQPPQSRPAGQGKRTTTAQQ